MSHRIAEEQEPQRAYGDLRRIAAALMRGERVDHTLEPTALAHEAWVRLLQSRNSDELSPGAFLGLAARTMRRILTEHARRKRAAKRGGDSDRTTLSGLSSPPRPRGLALDVDAALEELEGIDAELVRLVELRLFFDCTVEETARALGVSTRTVKRRWRFARAWLKQRLDAEER